METEKEKSRALLVSTYQGTSNKGACVEHLDELELLAETFGVETLHKEACPMRQFDASTYIGKGKLATLVEKAKEIQANLIIFDDEISPAQQRNLEAAFEIPVIDRTEVILGVFAQRAQTKEAQLQIELAKVKYEAPRLKRLWTHLSRQRASGAGSGGGAYLKGEGEKQIEIDRRILKRKIELLHREIGEVFAHRETQRIARRRSGIPIFAIIGYTNAGKSTLLNALTDSDVFVEDKLFATLDTTTRKFILSNNQEILLIDTVGFIRKLPHLLVAAFKSTLEESLEADILIHLIDSSHPMAEEQAATTFEVLKELGGKDKPVITVLNKVDKSEDQGLMTRLRMSYPKNVLISALKREGLSDLQEIMVKELSELRRKVFLRVPQSDYAVISEIIRQGHMIDQEYEENDVLIKAEIPAILAEKLARYNESEAEDRT